MPVKVIMWMIALVLMPANASENDHSLTLYNDSFIVNETTDTKLSFTDKKSQLKGQLPNYGASFLFERKRVFGNDDRTHIVNATGFYQSVGQIGEFCTGTLIGPRHVLTAAHCVYNSFIQQWDKNDDFSFIPGRVSKKKYAKNYDWEKITILKSFTKTKYSPDDFAIIFLKKKIGYIYGWNTLASNVDITSDVSIAGYPTDKEKGTLWQSTCPIDSTTGMNMLYRCDTFGGMSGSSIVIGENRIKTIVGIHTSSAGAQNSGVYITQRVFNILRGWIEKN